MPGQRRAIENQLNSLPESFTAKEIKCMYNALQADIGHIKEAERNPVDMEAYLHRRHKKLSFAYPTIFFRTVRGEMDQHIFGSLMALKARVDSGEIDDARAKEIVVDSARRHVEGAAPRAPRKEGGEVHEVIVRRRLEK